jgi:hypothetical protein
MAKSPVKNIPDPDTEEEGAAAEGAETPEPAKKKFSGKVIVLYIALPLLVLLGGRRPRGVFSGIFRRGSRRACRCRACCGRTGKNGFL